MNYKDMNIDMTAKWLCIYHGDCADGFTAAWVVRNAFPEGNVEFIEGTYSKGQVPDFTDKNVLVVDYSYLKVDAERYAELANRFIIIDHHATAVNDLVDVSEKVELVLDLERSGAMLAWDFFNPGVEAPSLVKHVQDRDLNRYVLPNTLPITYYIFSYEYTFENWDSIDYSLNNPGLFYDLLVEGEAIYRKFSKDANELTADGLHTITLSGIDIPAVNLPYIFSTMVAGRLSKTSPVSAAATWQIANGKLNISLRSDSDRDDCIDVAKLAESYGGGGHINSSGFRLELSDPRAIEIMNSIR